MSDTQELTRGQKAAATRAKNKAVAAVEPLTEAQADAVDALLAEADAHPTIEVYEFVEPTPAELEAQAAADEEMLAALQAEDDGLPVYEEPERPEPPVTGEGEVTFYLAQWAGTRLHGTGIKFENHYFVTSDPVQIARVEAWGLAERVT